MYEFHNTLFRKYLQTNTDFCYIYLYTLFVLAIIGRIFFTLYVSDYFDYAVPRYFPFLRTKKALLGYLPSLLYIRQLKILHLRVIRG